MLIPLHVKSHYSLGQGTAAVGALVARAARSGLPALALTDVENLYGQVIFHEEARAAGLRPITGSEIGSPRTGGRLVLLARDRSGYECLSRIITRRKLEGAGDPVASLGEDLAGLFLLTDDPVLLERLVGLRGIDRASLGALLVRPGRGGASLTAERRLAEAARRLEVALVADPDIVFLEPEDRRFHHLKVAIHGNLLLTRVEEERSGEGGRHFPSPRECAALFGDAPEAVSAARALAERCDLDLRGGRPIFPRIPLPEGETAASHLRRLAAEGLRRRFPRAGAAYRRRLERELRVIEKLGFPEYFIAVAGIVRFARARGIEVVGRGSGAGSLVAHLLDVTNVDPIEHDLYFERFLHEGRSDLPDIDLDLCWIRRDEVIAHVYKAYGEDRVAMISSHNTFQPRSAFRETAKAFGVAPEEVNRHSKKLPWIHPDLVSRHPLRDLILSTPLGRKIPIGDQPYRTALPLAERLLNQPHHLSVHPGGIVIADRRIDSYVPLERAQKGVVVTQYDMHSIEKVGLVKIDLLGNRCLTEIQETLDLARADGTDGTDGTARRLEEIPDGDPGTVETLERARTVGCFQLESPAMRSLLAKMRVRSIRDCIAAVAIIRPGAAAGSAKDAFIRRSNGEEPPRYLHPCLESVLGETHGVVIYEEDVMRVASALAGIPLAEGDELRSRIKKSKGPDDLRKLEEGFLARTAANGIPEDVARAAWKDLQRFTSYCFSKAHAAGYGVLAYQVAYLKTHLPVEFGCALLNHHAGMYSTRTIAEELRRCGVRILHPSVNRSEGRFTVERGPGGKAVRAALSRVKGLAASSLEAILAARRVREFRSLGDFLRRVPAPRREVEALILAGAFDGLPPPPGAAAPLNQPQLLWELETTLPSLGPARARPGPRRAGGGGGWLDLEGGRPRHPPLRDYDALTRVQNELHHLEMALTDHPMRLLRGEAALQGCLSTREAAGRAGERVAVAGIIAATREVHTRSGGVMQFITLEDEFDLLEATLFPRAFRAFAARIETLGPYVAEGRIEEDHRAVSLNVERIRPLREG